MTIDNRKAYFERCQQCGLIKTYRYQQRCKKGCAIQRSLKTYWHLIDQGKPQA